jgi:hypothetical protein
MKFFVEHCPHSANRPCIVVSIELCSIREHEYLALEIGAVAYSKFETLAVLPRAYV